MVSGRSSPAVRGNFGLALISFTEKRRDAPSLDGWGGKPPAVFVAGAGHRSDLQCPMPYAPFPESPPSFKAGRFNLAVFLGWARPAIARRFLLSDWAIYLVIPTLSEKLLNPLPLLVAQACKPCDSLRLLMSLIVLMVGAKAGVPRGG
jgi:hypothetical protein